MLIPESRKSWLSTCVVRLFVDVARLASEVESSRARYSILQIEGVDFFWPLFGILGGVSFGRLWTLLSGAIIIQYMKTVM